MNGERAASVAELLAGEGAALSGFFVGPGMLRLVAGVLAIFVVQGLVRWLVGRWGARTGSRDFVAVAQLGVRVVAYLAMLVLVGRIFFGTAPLLTAVMVTVVVSGVTFGVALRAQGWILGWALMLRGRIRIGDRLEVGQTRGVVRRLGLLRILLRSDDGARILVPTRGLTEASLTLSTPDQTVPVEVAVHLARPVDVQLLTRARRIAGLCPYRSWTTDYLVTVEGDDRVRIRLQAWSTAAAASAEGYLRDAFEELNAPPPET